MSLASGSSGSLAIFAPPAKYPVTLVTCSANAFRCAIFI